MRLSDIQQAVLECLQYSDEWYSIQDIAQQLQVHTNSVRLAATKLTNIGLIERKQQRDGKKGRPTLVFRARAGKFNVLYDAFRSIERATETEKEIIENVISGKYENCLEHETDLISALSAFLGTLGVTAEISERSIVITPEKYSEIDREIPGFSARVYRVVAQQAVGKRASVILNPELLDGNYVLTINLHD